MATVDLQHANHTGITASAAGSELRLAVTPDAFHVPSPDAEADGRYLVTASGALVYANAPDTTSPESVTVDASRALTDADHNKNILCTGTITLTVHAEARTDFQASVWNVGSGVITIAASGTATLNPTPAPELDNTGDATLSVLALLQPVTGGVWYVVAGEVPDTVTVIYDAGWPADRPLAAHVLAVGHTSAPAWLTSADVWFEDVS